MPSRSSALEKRKRQKSASSGDVEESSKTSLTTKDGKTADAGERSKSMSPRRSSWREEIKNMKGWRDELKERKKTKEFGHRQSRVIGDRVNKISSRFSKARNFQRYERLPSRHGSKTRLLKTISGKHDKKRNKDKKYGGARCTVAKKEEIALESMNINEVKANSGTSKKLDLVHEDEKGQINEQRVEQDTVESLQSDEDKSKIEAAAPEMKSSNSQQINGCNDAINVKEIKSSFDEKEPECEQGYQEAQDGDSVVLKPKKDGLETASSCSGIEPDSGVMARNFSLLELKMEVFTTRLKELEWEREQLRIERAALQVGHPELAANRICDLKDKE